MASSLIAALFGVAAVTVQAFPTQNSSQDIPSLTNSQTESFSPYTYFAKAAYCSPSTTLSWSCGHACDNLTGFQPEQSGGDGDAVQYWYVGYDPSFNTVVVAHQGTNVSHVMAVLTDVNLFFGSLNSTLFPGLPSDIKVHSGFRDEQAKTATHILSSVQTTMSKHGTTSVTLVGHSLGAALSLLDAIYLPLHLPSGTTFQAVLYGLPRVGNKAFANYVDAHVPHLTHINNLKDPVPILPSKFIGYAHASGEVHIQESGAWAACPGQDNPSKACTVGDVPNILVGNPANHDGPYNGIDMHCLS